MKKIILAITILTIIGCSTKKITTTSRTSDGDTGEGDTRTKPLKLLNDNTYLLEEQSTDSSYAFTRQNPVKVGGVKDGVGPVNQRGFLNALLGPNGEETGYFRGGSCCAFKTPHGMLDNTGMLDVYLVYWEGSDTLKIYINMYDEGDLQIPIGLTAKGTSKRL